MTSAVWRSRPGGIHDFASPPCDGFAFSILDYTAKQLGNARENVIFFLGVPDNCRTAKKMEGYRFITAHLPGGGLFVFSVYLF